MLHEICNWNNSIRFRFSLAFPLGGMFATEGMVPLTFLLIAYLLHTLGELCLSPVGLSLVTKLAPRQIVGFVMGFWFLSFFFSVTYLVNLLHKKQIKTIFLLLKR